MAELRELTDQSFRSEVLDSDRPALVDFWGDQCPACQQIAPILEALATEYAERVRILKCHAANNMATSNQFGIRAMPTVLVFAKGQVVGQLVGARFKSEFVELIEQALAS